MKIRSLEELNDKIDQDFAWRRKELTNILAQIDQAKNKGLETSLRAGILLLYAHWEGFIKNACEYYLNYVANKRLKYSELNECFVAIAFKKELNNCQQTNKSTIHTQAIQFILNCGEKRANIPNKGIINSASNLNSEILEEMLTTVGLDYSKYKLKENLIDIKLLKNRNEIAHGHYPGLDKNEFNFIYNEIIEIISDIKNCICNAAILEEYKRTETNSIEVSIAPQG